MKYDWIIKISIYFIIRENKYVLSKGDPGLLMTRNCGVHCTTHNFAVYKKTVNKSKYIPVIALFRDSGRLLYLLRLLSTKPHLPVYQTTLHQRQLLAWQMIRQHCINANC